MHNSKKLIIIVVTGLSFLVTACATPGRGENEQAGIIIGSILGGVLGSEVGKGHGRTAAIIAGTLIGSQIGGNVGRSMDDTDRLKAAHSLETVRTGVDSRWTNPDTGNQYTVRPTRTYSAASGPCREYTVDAIVAGKKEKIYGTACRQPDGSWKTMN
jgi:surface antigen